MRGDSVLVQIFACAGGRIDLYAFLGELVAGEQQVRLLYGVAGRNQHGVLRNPVSHREHGLQQGFVEVVAYAAHLARGGHVHAQHGVGLAQAGEGELRAFDAHVLQFEGVDPHRFGMLAKHAAGSKVDEVDFQHFRDEGKAS